MSIKICYEATTLKVFRTLPSQHSIKNHSEESQSLEVLVFLPIITHEQFAKDCRDSRDFNGIFGECLQIYGVVWSGRSLFIWEFTESKTLSVHSRSKQLMLTIGLQIPNRWCHGWFGKKTSFPFLYSSRALFWFLSTSLMNFRSLSPLDNNVLIKWKMVADPWGSSSKRRTKQKPHGFRGFCLVSDACLNCVFPIQRQLW